MAAHHQSNSVFDWCKCGWFFDGENYVVTLKRAKALQEIEMLKLLFRKSEKVGEAGEVITFDLDTKTLNDVKDKAAATLRNQ